MEAQQITTPHIYRCASKGTKVDLRFPETWFIRHRELRYNKTTFHELEHTIKSLTIGRGGGRESKVRRPRKKSFKATNENWRTQALRSMKGFRHIICCIANDWFAGPRVNLTQIANAVFTPSGKKRREKKRDWSKFMVTASGWLDWAKESLTPIGVTLSFNLLVG